VPLGKLTQEASKFILLNLEFEKAMELAGSFEDCFITEAVLNDWIKYCPMLISGSGNRLLFKGVPFTVCQSLMDAFKESYNKPNNVPKNARLIFVER